MTVPLRFAHLSDIHLPVEAADSLPLSQWLGKRAFSGLSWLFKRRHLHQKPITDALVRDIKATAPDMVLVSGDLINLSLPGEYRRAGHWLGTLGSPENVLAIPGNHDLLVDSPSTRAGLALYGPFMGGATAGENAFPVTQQHGDVLFIGLSTAIATPLGWCSGRLGEAQLGRLDTILKDAGEAGLCRIIALHHPPAAYPKRRGGLEDHAAFARVIAHRGAELIVHGHAHRAMLNALPGPGHGTVPVVGVASASVVSGKGYPAASWHEYSIQREAGRWVLGLNVHQCPDAGGGKPDSPWPLSARTLLRSG